MTSYEAEGQPQSAHGGMRVSDADRDEILRLLSTAYAEGRITLEEHDERTDLAARAKTFDDFAPLIGDLGPAGQTGSLQAQPGSEKKHPLIQRQQASEDCRVVSVLGGRSRRGTWKVPGQIDVTAVLGGVTLDFRDAVFTTDRVEITGSAVLGGIDILVPEGVNVIDQSRSVLGDAEVKGTVGHPEGPTIVLRCFHLMSGLDVKGPNTTWNKVVRGLLEGRDR